MKVIQRKDAKMQRREGARHLCRFSATTESGLNALAHSRVHIVKRPEGRALLFSLRLCTFASLR
jgi:hypothetical protein